MELFFSDRKRKKKNFFLSFTCTLFFSFVSCIASPSRLLLLFFSQIRQNTLFFVLFFYLYPPPSLISQFFSYFLLFFLLDPLSVRPAGPPSSFPYPFLFLSLFFENSPEIDIRSETPSVLFLFGGPTGLFSPPYVSPIK